MTLDLRYAAGLFDGEGHVAIQRASHRNWYLRSGISMTYRPIIECLRAQFGGCLSVNDYNVRTHGRRLLFSWTVTGKGAVGFLESVRPHLHVKAAEVDLVLEYMAARPDGRRWRSQSPEQVAAEYMRAETYRDQLRALRAA